MEAFVPRTPLIRTMLAVVTRMLSVLYCHMAPPWTTPPGVKFWHRTRRGQSIHLIINTDLETPPCFALLWSLTKVRARTSSKTSTLVVSCHAEARPLLQPSYYYYKHSPPSTTILLLLPNYTPPPTTRLLNWTILGWLSQTFPHINWTQRISWVRLRIVTYRLIIIIAGKSTDIIDLWIFSQGFP